MTPINENTSGRLEARRALVESRQSRRDVDTLIGETRDALAVVKASRESNHFADKFRAIIQGGYPQ
jgi:hypothetical protein